MRYRLLGKGLAPQKLKLEKPGWSGTNEPPMDGSMPQPWHCAPFVDGASYGFELLYPYDTECRVTTNGGRVLVDADFSSERVSGTVWPPLLSTNPGHYSFGSLVDIAVPDGWLLRVEPHPRYFTDTTGTVAAAVIGNLRTTWWPMFLFLTFKAPLLGQTHVFRRGDPVAQVLAVPRDSLSLEPMDVSTAQERERYAQTLMNQRTALAKRRWCSADGLAFDDVYRQLARVERSEGQTGVYRVIREAGKPSD